MATFDQLSAEQRAIIELVLKQGQSYQQLGETLAMPAARVARLARSALESLSPVSAAQVDEDWRGRVADYLLGQQTGPDAAVTRGHLRRSEAGRAWSRSLLDSLYEFYDPANVPTIPAGSGEAPAGEASAQAPRGDATPAAPEDATADGAPAALSPEARAIMVRRRVAGGAALGVVAVLMAVLVWPVGLFTGDDDKAPRAEQEPRIIGQLVLKPLKGTRGAGVAAIAERGKQRTLLVEARVAPTRAREAYEVWLYTSKGKARSLGAQVTDREGRFQGATTLPADWARFASIDVSRERVDGGDAHSGQSVLRGRTADFVAPAPPAPPAQR